MSTLHYSSLAAAILLALVFLMPVAVHADEAAPPPPAAPNPRLTVDEVIAIQLDALRRAAEDPAAMETVFRFASADNRKLTGPLERFAAMVRAEPYAVLVGHAAAWEQFSGSPEDLAGLEPGAAPPGPPMFWLSVVQVKGADGRTETFMWQLSRQGEDEPDAGCWMIDGVYPVPTGPQRDDGPGGELV